MDGRDIFRMGEVQHLGNLACIGKATLLQLRAHGAVHHKKVLPEQRPLQMLVLNGKPRQVGGGQLRRLRPTAGQLLVHVLVLTHGR